MTAHKFFVRLFLAMSSAPATILVCMVLIWRGEVGFEFKVKDGVCSSGKSFSLGRETAGHFLSGFLPGALFHLLACSKQIRERHVAVVLILINFLTYLYPVYNLVKRTKDGAELLAISSFANNLFEWAVGRLSSLCLMVVLHLAYLIYKQSARVPEYTLRVGPATMVFMLITGFGATALAIVVTTLVSDSWTLSMRTACLCKANAAECLQEDPDSSLAGIMAGAWVVGATTALFTMCTKSFVIKETKDE